MPGVPNCASCTDELSLRLLGTHRSADHGTPGLTVCCDIDTFVSGQF